MRQQSSDRYSGSGYDTYDRESEVDDDMAATHQRLAELKKQKEEAEIIRNRINDAQAKKNAFLAAQNELGEKMFASTEQIAQDLITMRQELEVLESLQTHISQNLKLLSTIQPEEWTPDNTEHQLVRGQEVMNRCEAEFASAVQETSRMKHIKPLSNIKRSGMMKMTFKEFSYQFMQGLSFHLALIVVALFVFIFYILFVK